jgi:hypothetical protein
MKEEFSGRKEGRLEDLTLGICDFLLQECEPRELRSLDEEDPDLVVTSLPWLEGEILRGCRMSYFQGILSVFSRIDRNMVKNCDGIYENLRIIEEEYAALPPPRPNREYTLEEFSQRIRAEDREIFEKQRKYIDRWIGYYVMCGNGWGEDI